MSLQFNDANIHFERGIFKAFSKHQPALPVFAQTARVRVNDVFT